MTILLDPQIRDWVVLPLFVIMVAAGLLRHAMGQLMQGDKVPTPLTVARSHSTLNQARRIRSGSAHFLSTFQWYVRKQHYAQVLKDTAEWCEDFEDESNDDDPMAAMMNPMGMLKGNMAFMVQNMVMMQGIQHFFSGFILLKVPFPLTVGFKSMFQKGMETLPNLDSSYVSSVSWYFLVMYGLRSFFKLAVGEPPLELREQENLLRDFGYQNQPNPAQKQDSKTIAKSLRAEAENLEVFLSQHKSKLDTVEKRLLGSRYPRKQISATDDFMLKKKGKRV